MSRRRARIRVLCEYASALENGRQSMSMPVLAIAFCTKSESLISYRTLETGPQGSKVLATVLIAGLSHRRR